jgi:golgi-specific brefeldin A-resistance guanine nucleotide exchange factor 1
LRLIFEEIIFPALENLLKPQVFQRDPSPGGMQETRMRMCSMLCKIFLHYLLDLNESAKELNDLWLKILNFYDRFLNCGKKDQLAESLPETVKNILLVMHASQILVPPPPKGAEEPRSPAQIEMWTLTAERLSKFLPSMLDEVLSRADVGQAPAPPLQDAPDGAQGPSA